MEEKYRKIAVELNLKKEDEDISCCESVEATTLENKQAKKIEGLELQVKTLTTLLIENKSKLDKTQELYEEYKRNYYKLEEKIYQLNDEIEDLERIINKLMEKKKK